MSVKAWWVGDAVKAWRLGDVSKGLEGGWCQ